MPYLNAKIEDCRVLGLDPVEEGFVSAEYYAAYKAAWAEEDRQRREDWERWDVIIGIDEYLGQFCPKPPPMEPFF